MKPKKLLHKTQQIYFAYFIASVLIVALLFYYVTRSLYIENTDEFLYNKKELFIQNILPKLQTNHIELWNQLHADTKIVSDIHIQKEKIFDTLLFNPVEKEYEPYRMIYSPVTINGMKYTYIDKINLLESEDLILNIVGLFVLLIVLLFIGNIIITHLISKKTWKSFYQLLDEIEKFELDKNNIPAFQTTSIIEFNRLNQCIHTLIQKNMKIYEWQKEFTENAAHELQTPIAVIRAKIDNILQSAELNEQQAKWLMEINENILRLSRLNKNLLLLSKLDKQLFYEKESVDVVPVIKKHLHFFEQQALSKNINIKTSLIEQLQLYVHKDLLDIIISNLFQNAIRHNYPNGEIQIILTKEYFLISNTSQSAPIPPEKLFSRFSKLNSSAEGTGLGLHIVYKACHINDWKIEYSYENSYHTFKILF